MGFMETMQAKMDATFVPLAAKLNGQRHVAAVRDAFTLAFPLTLAGSIITLVNFAVLDPNGFIAKILRLGDLIPNLSDYQQKNSAEYIAFFSQKLMLVTLSRER